MTDPVTTARTARERIAQGLSTLQSPGAPPTLMNAAEPIAQAMSALHQIEASHGAAAAQYAPTALDALRRALALLQAQPAGQPAVDQTVEAIAGSLGLVHSLSQAAAAAAAPTAFDPSPPTQPSAAATQPAPAPAQWQQPAPQAPAQQPQWQQRAPQVPAQQPQWQQPAPQAQYQQAPPQPAAPPAAGFGAPLRVDAELGAHSATNFYKGLSGNDVIDSGGIFIATYQIPEIGQNLIIKVSLPGGYEFEATGVVRWTRDAPNSGADSSPGYGAQFTQITPEGRQLVYRYVRNREPLFHDDL